MKRMSNGEGYPDRTAEVAIFNVMRESDNKNNGFDNKKKEKNNGTKGRTKIKKGQKT